MADDMRAAFEKWYADKILLKRDADNYVYVGARQAWIAWQAAIAWERERVAKVPPHYAGDFSVPSQVVTIQPMEWDDAASEPAKMKPLSDRTFARLAAELAMSYAPPIIKCGACDHPVLTGYRCTYCGETNPSKRRTDDAID